jgi:hypothetical protein
MRLAAFLVPIALILLVASNANPAFVHQQQMTPGGLPEIVSQDSKRSGDTVRMWKRAEIRVVPADRVAADNAELQSLRDRVVRAELDSSRLAPADRAVRDQLLRQRELMYALLTYAEHQDSDRGKSPTALEVQKKLNKMEGQMMCEACHTRMVARTTHSGVH